METSYLGFLFRHLTAFRLAPEVMNGRAGGILLSLLLLSMFLNRRDRHKIGSGGPQNRSAGASDDIRMCQTTNDSTAKMSMIQSIRETCSVFPKATLITVQLRNPQMIPWVIE